MANYTLTTSPQEVGRNTSVTVGARLLAWYSNASTTNALVHLKLQAISQGTAYVGTNKNYQLILGSTDTGTVTNPGDVYTQDTWVDVREITQTVNFNTTVSVAGKIWTYVYGDAWVTGNTVTMPSLYVAPTKPTISAIPGVSSVIVTYGTTSFGVPTSGTVTLYGGTSPNPTTVLDTYSNIRDHSFTHTGLTPGTTYYYRARANNGQLDSSYSTEVVATPVSGVIETAATLYGSVSDQASHINKLYGSVGDRTVRVNKLYASGNGRTKLTYKI